MKVDTSECVGRMNSNSSDGPPVDIVLERTLCNYEDHSRKFLLSDKDFTKQFFHVYTQRLASMKELLLPRINQMWGVEIPVKRLADLKDDEPSESIIIGTLYKHQELKPSILKEISEEHQLVPQPLRSEFTGDEDQLLLEDELQRIRLVGALNVHDIITGVVCAVLGTVHEGGKFQVKEHCFPSPPAVERPLPINKDIYIILVSGLDLAGSPDVLFPLQLMVDWVSGWLGDLGEQKTQALVARTLFAGNCIRLHSHNRGAALQNVSESLDHSSTLDAVKHFDEFLVQLAGNIPVDVMPGQHDPSNGSLPQQPMHCCMFPQAAVYKTFRCVPNPYEFDIGGRRILGTAGQPVDDVASYSRITDRLEILQRTLQWGHLAPSAPDTLRSYPYTDSDPFIIKELPDVYFVGNQPQYQTKLFRGIDEKEVRLICLPKFAESKTCVVLNLLTLDCHPMSFGSLSSDELACDAEK